MTKYLGLRSKHHRTRTTRDSAMSAAMHRIKASNPGIPQTQVLSMASKSISGKGYHLHPHHAHGMNLHPHHARGMNLHPYGKGLQLF